MLFRKPKIKSITVRVANQVNLGNYNLWKNDITAEVEVGDGDVAATVKATQIMLCKQLISKQNAEFVVTKTKESFK